MYDFSKAYNLSHAIIHLSYNCSSRNSLIFLVECIPRWFWSVVGLLWVRGGSTSQMLLQLCTHFVHGLAWLKRVKASMCILHHLKMLFICYRRVWKPWHMRYITTDLNTEYKYQQNLTINLKQVSFCVVQTPIMKPLDLLVCISKRYKFVLKGADLRSVCTSQKEKILALFIVSSHN